uniref:Ovule protein n=1 Tax=Ascaris lumbricoides TaxID=6252 RepID=A0A0M3I6Z9_ASCLU
MKPCSHEIFNYRPVSLTSSVFIVVEVVVPDPLYNHSIRINFSSSNQWHYSIQRSIVHNVNN